jgi:hypothetical protein
MSIIEISLEDERQELLRALRLADKYCLPGVPDMIDIKEQLKKLKI